MVCRKSLGRIVKKYESFRITKDELRKLLESGIFGRVTGVIGPFVLRYQNNKLIISERPKIFHMSMSQAAITGRNNFCSKIRLARFLNNIRLIKSIWQKADMDGTCAWTRLVKYNNIKDQYPTVNNTITPGKAHFTIKQICSLEKDFSIRIADPTPINGNETLFIVIIPFDPIKKYDNPFEIIRVKDLLLNEDQIAVCRRFKRFVMYNAIVRQNGNSYEWSNTLAIEGNIPVEKKCGEELVLEWLFEVEECLAGVRSQSPEARKVDIHINTS